MQVFSALRYNDVFQFHTFCIKTLFNGGLAIPHQLGDQIGRLPIILASRFCRVEAERIAAFTPASQLGEVV
ncbi:hypothetical protein BZK31_12040 [Pseudomonas floridensis]|uniref:Uncharacterized protein n=1 Tax=Pseudomonas floridensis TaxID=1958950 RepID=A0A1X0N6G4_9PSED|nr:hypothetical protein BZK31_12040 [Pseudomonas floridensis]